MAFVTNLTVVYTENHFYTTFDSGTEPLTFGAFPKAEY